jgi:carboxyl-terminal processing protease
MSKRRVFGVGSAVALAIVLSLFVGSWRSFAGPSYQELALLTNVLHLVQQHYVKEVETRKLIDGALKGMLDALDPHTSYLSEEFYKEVQLDTKGEFEGLGIEITKRDGFVTVVAPIDGTPAATAGIKAKDQIVAVCPDVTDKSCLSTQEMNLLEAVKQMRGPRGSKVMIQVLREGWTTPKPFVLERAAIKIASVTLKQLDDAIPYVRVSQFQERTAEDLEASIEKIIADRGKIDGLVLDLRDDPGGLLDQAVKVADLFLDDGLIVFSEGRNGENRMEWHAKKDGTLSGFPIVVLVNGGSASASEIVAGSLQDHKRALLLGTKTFGKGSVQTIIPLDDGSGLRLTTALYYLPSGRSIQEVGVQPDVTVEPFSEAEVAALGEPRKTGATVSEQDLAGHLSSEKAKPAPAPAAAEPDSPLARDKQLQHAYELLKSWTIFSRLPAELRAQN